MNNTNTANERYHGLDFLRAIAMMLGVLLHAQLLYIDIETLAEIDKNLLTIVPEASLLNFTLFVWIHLWRMPVFFILAGFFAHIVINRKGDSYFIIDRIIRILCPLILFMLFYAYIFQTPITELGHLWFLYYLVLFYALLYLLVGFFSILSKIIGDMPSRIFTIFHRWLFSSPKTLLFLIIPMILLNFLARDSGLWNLQAANILEIKIKAFIFFFFFFLIGYFLSENKQLLQKIACKKYVFSSLGVGLLLFLIAIAFFIADETAEQSIIWREATVIILAGSAIFFWAFGIIAFSTVFFFEQRRWISFLVEISYSTYLIHIVIVIGFAAFLISEQLEQHFAILINCIVSLIICIAFYYVFVKYTPLGWLINGYHKSPLKINVLKN